MVLFTPNQLYYIGIKPCDDSKGETIAHIISEVAQKIKDAGSNLIAVCCDNAKNNIAALDYCPNSAQKLSGQNFMRFPSVYHTANLAAKDLFTGKYQEILDYCKYLIYKFNELPQENKIFGKIPSFKEVRWFSLAKCVIFIINNINYLDEQTKQYYMYIQNKYDWRYISAVLSSVNFFIKKMEKNSASIADIYINFEFTLNELKTISNLYLRNPETNFAIDFHNKLVTRFSTTVEMNLPYLAFMLTGYGINSLNFMTQEKIIIQSVAKKTFEKYVKGDPNEDKLMYFYDKIFEYRFLTNLQFCFTTEQSVAFWKNVIAGCHFWRSEPLLVQENRSEFDSVHKLFAKIALEILSIPCSECACERVFSHLGDILMSNKRHLNYQMLNALMMIRINSIFLKQGGKDSNHFINNELTKLSTEG